MTQPVDSSILHEIVRVVDSRRKVPEKVIVKSKEYALTYLEDHQRRLEEALQRFDNDRLNMLYGQLASKIKYQLLRRVPARPAAAPAAAVAKKAAAKKAVAKKAAAKPARAAKPAKPVARKKAAAAKRRAGTAKRKPATKRSTAKTKPAAKKRR